MENEEPTAPAESEVVETLIGDVPVENTTEVSEKEEDETKGEVESETEEVESEVEGEEE